MLWIVIAILASTPAPPPGSGGEICIGNECVPAPPGWNACTPVPPTAVPEEFYLRLPVCRVREPTMTPRFRVTLPRATLPPRRTPTPTVTVRRRERQPQPRPRPRS
ncbi:MAG: hypothetical protein NZ572_08155 [Thermoflexus sp.]|nr:hypothetical protein [Thermoflexus sp.]